MVSGSPEKYNETERDEQTQLDGQKKGRTEREARQKDMHKDRKNVRQRHRRRTSRQRAQTCSETGEYASLKTVKSAHHTYIQTDKKMGRQMHRHSQKDRSTDNHRTISLSWLSVRILFFSVADSIRPIDRQTTRTNLFESFFFLLLVLSVLHLDWPIQNSLPQLMVE